MGNGLRILFLAVLLVIIVFFVIIDKKNKGASQVISRSKRGGKMGLFGRKAQNESESGIVSTYIDKFVETYFTSEYKTGCLNKNKDDLDKGYDDFVLKNINEKATKEIALKKIGVDETQINEVTPICFQGYEEDAGVLSRYGLDGRFRTSQYSVTWIFFSNSQIFVFKIFMDLLTHKTKIVTNEYFYKDITNFSSRFSSYEYEKAVMEKGCLKPKLSVDLKKVEIQKFAIIVPGDEFYCSVTGVADIERIIQGLKQKLREKKEEK